MPLRRTKHSSADRERIAYKLERKGTPIFIDEADRFGNAKNIVKSDEDIYEKNQYCPCFIMASNNVNGSFEPEITKRMIRINIDCRTTKLEASKNDKAINTAIRSVHNAYYREYLRIIFSRLDAFIEKIEDRDDSWNPDIFKLSSEVICEIASGFGEELPSWMKVLTIDDYMTDKYLAEKALAFIRNEITYNQNAFSIQRRKNLATIDCTNDDNNTQNANMKMLRNDLPADCKIVVSGSRIVVNDLSALERYLGFRLKKKRRLFNHT